MMKSTETNTTNMKTAEIKARAWERLRSCFAEASFISLLNIGIFLITYLLVIAAGRFTGAHTADTLLPVFSSFPPAFMVSLGVILIAAYILAAPVYYGTRWFFWQAASGNIMPASSVFAGYSSFEQFKLCVKLRMLSAVRRLPYLLVFGTAVIVEAYLGRSIINGGGHFMAVFIYAGIGAVTAAVVYVCFFTGLRCVPVGFLLANDPDGSVTQIFERSEEIIRHNGGRLVKLYISFAGWFIACLPAFPVIILMPYFYMSEAVFLKDCMADEREMSGADKTEKESEKVMA